MFRQFLIMDWPYVREFHGVSQFGASSETRLSFGVLI